MPLKSVSIRNRPGRTRQEVTQLKTPISLKLCWIWLVNIQDKTVGQNILFPESWGAPC